MGTLSIFQIKKSIFLKVFDIVRKIDIWPENDILGVLEWFGSLIWYLESSRTNFEKIEKKSHFLDFWLVGHHNVRVEISADRPEIGRIIWPDPRKTSKLFPKKKVNICSSSFRRTPKNRVFAPRAQNHTCGQIVAFVVFVAFWGTTMLFFKKFKIKAFKKYMVYGVISNR